jgi:zinc transporter ZupT
MIGFFLQIIMEFFSEGIEHGHMHIHHDHKGAFPTTMMISLCLHSLLEGMPLAGKLTNGYSDRSLLFGIILHHLPVAFALVSMLVASGIGNKKVIIYLSLFAIMAPLGAFSSNFIGGNILTDYSEWFDKMMAIVIGIFLHISTTILFESSSNHRFNLYKMIAIISGGLIGILAS